MRKGAAEEVGDAGETGRELVYGRTRILVAHHLLLLFSGDGRTVLSHSPALATGL